MKPFLKINHIIYRLANVARKLYWRTFHPKTFGAQVLLKHPQNKNLVLLIRHTYGNQTLWNIPGGGYNPKKETAATAATREVLEELGVEVIDLQELGEYNTSDEGKIDTVTLFSSILEDIEGIRLSP
jgi:8-oxo-dGTP diphosphatase